ncbi:MAG: sulfotransferase family protein [Planctomycetota bacterium]
MRAKVFGIGLNKTGTTTLGACLEHLGYRHLSHRHDLLKLFRKGRIDDVFAVMDDYDSFEDWPYPLMVDELLERYGPDSKFILTRRSSAEKWLKSIENHAIYTSPFKQSRKLAYGYWFPQAARQQHLAFYEEHLLRMRKLFADRGEEHRLLEMCWEEGDGWQELCSFLGLTVPDESLPVSNVTATRKSSGWELLNRLLIAGLTAAHKATGYS